MSTSFYTQHALSCRWTIARVRENSMCLLLFGLIVADVIGLLCVYHGHQPSVLRLVHSPSYLRNTENSFSIWKGSVMFWWRPEIVQVTVTNPSCGVTPSLSQPEYQPETPYQPYPCDQGTWVLGGVLLGPPGKNEREFDSNWISQEVTVTKCFTNDSLSFTVTSSVQRVLTVLTLNPDFEGHSELCVVGTSVLSWTRFPLAAPYISCLFGPPHEFLSLHLCPNASK